MLKELLHCYGICLPQLHKKIVAQLTVCRCGGALRYGQVKFHVPYLLGVVHYVFSAPGRTEISGNHTDHQCGCVLAAAVNLETVADVRLNGANNIWVQSEGYPTIKVTLDDLSVHEEEKNTTAALIRGVASSFVQRGAKLEGFDAVVNSTVLPGSGLSSSAAFEVLFGTILNELFFDKKLTAVEIAQIGQYAENVYFGKPCGLMDQMASSVGGLVYIDFENPENPVIEKINFDLAKAGYALCIIDSGADHADLTDEYAAIPYELKEVCDFFGKEVLRQIPEEDFLAALEETIYRYHDTRSTIAEHWNEKVCKAYKAYYGKNLNIPRWNDIKSKYIKESSEG